MSIKFEQVTKHYNSAPVVNDVSLRIDAGEFFVLLGPSGSGKSTLLRLAAGLSEVHHGRISLHGRDVTHLRARDRGVGLVFQHYALFRHMTVGENVEFALRIRGVRRGARAQRREQLLQLVALEGYSDRMPDQLSGGQQQRVAVARSLAHEPQVLLLDEPFGALDAKIRVELRETIRDVQRRLGMTTILVTHDQEEAFSLADRIGIMHNGRLLETGRPESLYRHPATRFVATFLGAANLFLGELGPAGLRLGTRFVASGASLRATKGDQSAEQQVVTVVRPEDIEVAEQDEQLHSGVVGAGPVLSVDFNGASERLRVQLEPEWDVVSAIGREHRANSSGPAPSRDQQIVDVTRNSTEQARFALKPGQRVALGIRRFHLLPTPIASFRLLGTVPATAASLRSSPLLRQLVESMQAPVLDALDAPAEASEREGMQAGVGVIAGGTQSIGEIARAAVQGRRWLLCIPPRATLPSRILIHCEHEAARSSTLRLVASVMRHLHAEATFVSLQSPAAPRAEATTAFRRLLDARAELQEIHGLDIRTDVHIGDPPGWAAQIASSAQPALVVLGIESAPGELARILGQDFGALFTDASTSVVLLSYTESQAQVPGARLDAISPLFPLSGASGGSVGSGTGMASTAEVRPGTLA